LNHIKFAHGDLVVDCGANLGDLYLYFKEKEIEIDYFAFEPSELDFDCLRANVQSVNSKLFKKGLFNKSGDLSFYVSVSGADSSLINPGFYDKVETVDVIRLDSLAFDSIKLFKVEAEGAEPEVLEGALGLLPKIDFISVDAGFERGEKHESTLVEVMNFLTAHNFELVALSHERVVALFRNKQANIS
jgi:FkbM family methyltransferase